MTKIPDLFKIETNINFRWEEITDLNNREAGIVNQVASHYDLVFQGLRKMIKRNKASTLYRLTAPGRDYVLRAVSESEAGILEIQSKIANNIAFTNIVKPIINREGFYVTCKEGLAWMLYAFQPGELFSGRENDLIAIFKECLDLLGNLKQIKGESGLITAKHHPEVWSDTLLRFIDSKQFEMPPFTHLLSQRVRDLLVEYRHEIKDWAVQAARLDVTTNVELTHNDLNHSNLVIWNGRPFVLDIEDICFENSGIAAGHCIFKMLRHSIYSGAQSIEKVRKDYLPRTLQVFLERGFDLGDRDRFFLFAAFRIFSDIQMILDRILVQKVSQLPTDLEKKIMNLFELECLVA